MKAYVQWSRRKMVVTGETDHVRTLVEEVVGLNKREICGDSLRNEGENI